MPIVSGSQSERLYSGCMIDFKVTYWSPCPIVLNSTKEKTTAHSSGIPEPGTYTGHTLQ